MCCASYAHALIFLSCCFANESWASVEFALPENQFSGTWNFQFLYLYYAIKKKAME